ncbi:PleD family two-component system response regulator [Halalkalibaculum sp. DA3122]|uniref:response regulator n=1 Tax=unclassified Halalkalibaculum TaxID=2964617 RepID=UPI0037541EEF
MDYNILVIDDDEPMHIMAKNLLGEEFTLIHARDAQEGIDILSEKVVNLIMSDIHMPGISGLEFLESLMEDAEKRAIPVLVITNLPTVDKEKKALELGAADFIEKPMFVDQQEEVLNRVRMKLVTNIDLPDISNKLVINKKRLVSALMSEAIGGDFVSTARTLCQQFQRIFNIDSISFWTISGGKPNMISSSGKSLPPDYGGTELKKEQTFQQLLADKEPYMTNHVFNEERGVLADFSKEHNFPAEIGIPMFAIDERKLLRNKMSIPEDTDLFAYVILKRNKLFSTKEFKVISKLLTQIGSIFWRLYKDI